MDLLALPQLVAREDPNGNCTRLTCPPSESIYGYAPNLAASVFFLVIFALSGLVYVWQGIKTKTWFFSTAMVIGCIAEVLGYAAKLILHHDSFSQLGFIMSVVVLTFAPAFYTAGIYYTLKHICLTFNPTLSRLRPNWYTYVFIAADVLSIVLQAAGGAVSSASTDDSTLKIGDDVMIAGLAFQVFTLTVFGVLAADYFWTVHRHRESLNPETAVLRRSMRFRLFLGALTVAYLAILIRCCYRVAELAGGWSHDNKILRTEGLFIGLDSVPCTIAALALNIWHPGWCFPKHKQQSAIRERTSQSGQSSSTDSELEKGGDESS